MSGMMQGMPQGPAAGMSQGPMSSGQGAPPQMSPQMMQALMAMRAQQGGGGGQIPQGQQMPPQMQHPPMPPQGMQSMPPQQPQMPPHLQAPAMQMQPQQPMLSQGIPSVPHPNGNIPGPGTMQSPGAQAQRSVPINNPNLAMFGRAATASPGAPVDPSKLKLTGAEWAQMGRFGDTIIAHLTPGEIAIPPQVQTPQLMKQLDAAFKKAKVSVPQFTAGSPKSSVNPKSGLPEYNWLASVLPLLAAGGLAATGVGLGADALGLGAVGADAAASAVPGAAASAGIAGGTGALDADTIGSLAGVASDGAAAGDAGTAVGGAGTAVGGAGTTTASTAPITFGNPVQLASADGSPSALANQIPQSTLNPTAPLPTQAVNAPAPTTTAANTAVNQSVGASGAPGTVQSSGAVQPGAQGDFSSPSEIQQQVTSNSTPWGNQAAGSSSNGLFGSISNWVNNNQALALKLGIAGGGGLLAAGASMLGPHSKSPLQSSQYTAHMPAVNPNYQQLLGNASKGYQSTPQFAGYNPVSSVTSTNGPYNFYNPSMNTG